VLAGIAASHYGAHTIEQWGTLRTRAPWLVGALIVVAISMIGLPPTGGFFGKWYMILGAIQAGEYGAVAAVIVATLLTLAYFALLIVRVFGGQAVAAPPAAAMPLPLRVCVGVLCTSIVTLGLFSDRIISLLLIAIDPVQAS
jgi:multicomponent Na+:H+ antiporter subunit D